MSLGLLNLLKRNHHITDEQYTAVRDAYEKEREENPDASQSVLSQLFYFQALSPQELANILSDIYGYPIFDLTVYDTSLYPAGFADDDDLIENRVLPIYKRENRLYLAVSDPTLEATHRKMFFPTGYDLSYVLAEDDALSAAFDQVRRESTSIFQELQKDEIFNPIKMMHDDGTSEDGPIAKFVNKIIQDAVATGASDIHFEFYEFYARIRFRMDGVLKEIVQPPLVTKDKIASRIKVMSKLDISEKRIPQDGNMKLKISRKRTVDFRVSTLPTTFGEKIVMRVLDNTVNFLKLEQLGMSEKEQEMLLTTIHRPYGMILVTGPTGSGKTVTLYNCLNLLNKPEVNISTVEDPVEINLPGTNQVNMNVKQGLDFARALKAFLRQDPDIIMVGEIRDLETADIALKASQTGHLVFSTLHTNDAPGSLTRLTNMGVQPFNVASSVLLIIAQRLVRKLCPICKRPIRRLPEEILYKLKFTPADLRGEWRIYEPVGCKHCKGTGYKGRVGIFEMMPVTDRIQKSILKDADETEIRNIALEEGMRTLRRAGLEKIKEGITSIEEVTSITN